MAAIYYVFRLTFRLAPTKYNDVMMRCCTLETTHHAHTVHCFSDELIIVVLAIILFHYNTHIALVKKMKSIPLL